MLRSLQTKRKSSLALMQANKKEKQIRRSKPGNNGTMISTFQNTVVDFNQLNSIGMQKGEGYNLK